MRVYIWNKSTTGKMEKLFEAKKGDAYLLRDLWINDYNSKAKYSEAMPVSEAQGDLLIIIEDKFPSPVGQ